MALRRTLPTVARVVGPALVGILAAWLALLIAGRHTYGMGPFRVELYARPGANRTELALPPFGRLEADTHLAPLRLSATLEEVAATQLQDIVQHKGVEGLALEVEEEGLAVLGAFVWRSLGVVLAGAALGGLLMFRERWKATAAAIAAALLVFGTAASVSWLTYRPEAFRSPTFTGPLALAPRLIGPVEEATGRLRDFRVELERLVGGAVEAYGTIAAAQPTMGSGVVLLHMSDVHLSPIGMDFAQRLASSFDVDLVVDTGDLTSFGTSLEQGIAGRIAGFGVPYVFVRGNHDSTVTAAEVAAQPNATVLDHQAQEVAGLRIFGAPHPLFTPTLERSYPGDRIEESVRNVGDVVAQEIEDLEPPPDILAVHDDRMAEGSAGLVPVVLSGHFHETRAAALKGTIYMRVGTTGAGGLDTFTGPDRIPLAAQVLYFDGEPLTLVAWDTVELDPVTRDLTVRRHLSEETLGDAAEPAPQGGPAPTP